MTYYNEWDPYTAQWLRNLMAAGAISSGSVDQRSIKEVQYETVARFERVHFFAGIAGWDLALKLAGWPADLPVWTGSCPCQPFSAAGKREGYADKRHLWPEFRRLISECEPPTIFGEQVNSKDGRLWLSDVRSDLEALGYRVGAADLCAASVEAPHKRQRLYWVAHHDGAGFPELQRQQAETAAYGRAIPYTASRWEIEPSLGRLADGLPGQVGRLRAYGNAIVPQVAAEFIMAFMDTIQEGQK